MLNESRSGTMSEDELAIAESEGVKKIIGHPERVDNLVEEVVALGGSAEGILPKEMYQRIVELQDKIDLEGPLPAALNNELVHLQDIESKMFRNWIRDHKTDAEMAA